MRVIRKRSALRAIVTDVRIHALERLRRLRDDYRLQRRRVVAELFAGGCIPEVLPRIARYGREIELVAIETCAEVDIQLVRRLPLVGEREVQEFRRDRVDRGLVSGECQGPRSLAVAR